MPPAASLREFLLSLPNVRDLSERSLILLVARYLLGTAQTSFTRAELAREFAGGSLPVPRGLEARLRRLSAGRAAPLIKVPTRRYALSVFGQKEVTDYLGTMASPAAGRAALTALVGRISGDAEQRFLAEAIACLEVKARRAAVVMVWLMTVDHLERFVLAHKLAEFNAAWARRHDNKGRTIGSQDDFLEIRDENTLVEILRSANIVTKDVKKILDENLGFRNTCAHPNDIVVRESKVLASIEDLVYNVVLKYPL